MRPKRLISLLVAVCMMITMLPLSGEGFVAVALSWIVLSIFGAIPFVITGEIPSYVDALFETISGFTTTGASILSNVEALTHTSLMWRSFTHWVGGMGVLVFIMSFLPLMGGSTINLMKAESPGPSVSRLVPHVKVTDGSAAVAKRFRISDLVIGLTIVAFGTSAPELVISVLSALNGSAEMAICNVVGSNIFNALMIIGCTALVLPIKVGEGTMSKEIPLVILSSLVLFVCANDMMLDREAVNVISRSDGFVLLAFFLIFMRYTFAIARNGADEAGEEQKIKEMPVWKSVLYIAGGLAGLIFGGQLFVDGASGLARSWGVSESVIGLTLVAGGRQICGTRSIMMKTGTFVHFRKRETD